MNKEIIDGSEPGTPQGTNPSSVSTKSDEKIDIAISNKDQFNPECNDASLLGKPWKVSVMLKKFWDFAKKPESTSVAMALATIIIAFATWRTWREVQQGSVQTDKIVQSASKIQTALETANLNYQQATLASNEISRESVEAVQRAFMIWRALSMDPPLVIKGPEGEETYLDVDAVWENNGATPATDTIYYYRVEKLPSEPNEEAFLGDKKLLHETSYLGPKNQTSQIGRKPLSFYIGNKKITSTRRHDPDIFFWGWVVYRDVFPKTKPHLTEFCQYMVTMTLNVPPETKVLFPPPAGGNYRIEYMGCKQHNCVDQYCNDYDDVIKLSPNPK